MKKYVAESVGTFWLVLGGCGSAVLAAAFPEVGIGLLGVSLGAQLKFALLTGFYTLVGQFLVRAIRSSSSEDPGPSSPPPPMRRTTGSIMRSKKACAGLKLLWSR